MDHYLDNRLTCLNARPRSGKEKKVYSNEEAGKLLEVGP